MSSDGNIDALFVATRAIHFGACLILLTIFVFDHFVVRPAGADSREIARRWRTIQRWLGGLALPLALLSGAAWFAFVAAQMSGLRVREAMHQDDVAGLVWNATHFGRLWKLRTVVGFAMLIMLPAALMLRRGSVLQVVSNWSATLLAGIFVAGLAWAGHGQTGGPPAWHLAADALHLLVSGCWPAGLLPLALLLAAIRRSPGVQEQSALESLVRRFSATALTCVLLLIVTGLANAWFLVGSPPALVSTNYGLVLLTKIALFAGMVTIGAVNLLRLKPRLLSSSAEKRAAASRLLRNVILEVILAAAVIGAVGILGLLSPPAEHMSQEHHHIQSEDR